jgi:hypothetical protein
MDRYQQFGLRGDADEQIRRAVRDGFKRAGLSAAAMRAARDCGCDAKVAAAPDVTL